MAFLKLLLVALCLIYSEFYLKYFLIILLGNIPIKFQNFWSTIG